MYISRLACLCMRWCLCVQVIVRVRVRVRVCASEALSCREWEHWPYCHYFNFHLRHEFARIVTLLCTLPFLTLEKTRSDKVGELVWRTSKLLQKAADADVAKEKASVPVKPKAALPASVGNRSITRSARAARKCRTARGILSRH